MKIGMTFTIDEFLSLCAILEDADEKAGDSEAEICDAGNVVINRIITMKSVLEDIQEYRAHRIPPFMEGIFKFVD